MTEKQNKKETKKPTEEDLEEALKEEEETEEPVEKEEAKEETPEEAEKTEGAEEEKPAEEKEKTQPAKEKKAEEEEEIVEERIYTVPLGKALITPPRRRTPRAMRMLRTFIIKHMKLEAKKPEEGEEEEEPPKLTISNEVNEKLWRRGIEKPPRKIRIRAAKDKDGNVTVYLAEGE
ncbi:50S ribosomal protein L31e [Candidatus Bathyarchaeota archaeon]|nr:50S ribosomal protein L31e [Candidatus Bathyarchaeota archaeon]